jgi:uncharacterized membrane protein
VDRHGIDGPASPRSADRRQGYLDEVGRHLRMPDNRRDDVLDELAAHLEDAVTQLITDGRSRDDAEAEALRRLGSPDDLGDALRRTHQRRGACWPPSAAASGRASKAPQAAT